MPNAAAKPGTKRMTASTQSRRPAAQKSRGVGCLRGVRAVRMLGRSGTMSARRGIAFFYKEAVGVEVRPERAIRSLTARGGRSSRTPNSMRGGAGRSQQSDDQGSEARVRQARAFDPAGARRIVPYGQRQCRCDPQRQR